MKIDKECIDETVEGLAKEWLELLSNSSTTADSLIAFAHMGGIVDLAEELKKELDA